MRKLCILAAAALFVAFGCNQPEPENPDNPNTPETPENPLEPENPQDPENQENQGTPEEPATTYQLVGRFSYGGTEYGWGNETPVDLAALEGGDGWLQASVGVPGSYIDIKLAKDGGSTYTGTTLEGRQIVGTYFPIAADGAGNSIAIFTNRTSLDVYFNPSLGRLFTLPAGADFVVPTTEGGSAVDQYALIGYHNADNWTKDVYQEAMYGFDDWRVTRICTTGSDARITFKYRRNGDWTEQIGGIFKYDRRSATCCYAKTGNYSDFDFTPGTAGEYDVYLKKDFSTVFILPAGEAFNVPGRKEQSDLVTKLYIIGGINGHNWDKSYTLTFPSSDNHDWYTLQRATKIAGWGAMVFKIYNGNWGVGMSVGWPSQLEGAIGSVATVYPLCLRDSEPDIPNIQLDTNGGEVDIYIKADLSEIFTLPHGTQFYVPSASSATPPKAVFIGDSITYFWNSAERGNPSFFSSHNYWAKGVEGQTSATIKARFNWDVVSNGPQQVHILCGTNDLAGNGGSYVPPADICKNIADMAAAAKAAGIEVFIGSLLPCNYLWWNPSVNPADNIVVVNGLLKTLCEENGYTYVNYYDALVGSGKGLASEYSLDGCHPTKAAYSVMEGIVLPLMEK